MSLFSLFSTDQTKETNGVAIAYPPNPDGTIPTFYLARQSRSNQRFTAALKKSTAPLKRQIELDAVPDAVAEAAVMAAFIAGCMVSPGWQNVQGADGTVIPFTADNAKALFTQLPDLYDDLNAKSKSAASFRDDELDANAKN